MALEPSNPFEYNDIGKYILPPASVQPDRPETRYVVVHHADAFYSPGLACASIFKAHCTRPDFGDYHRIGYHDVLQLERNAMIGLHHVNPPLMQAAGVAKMNHLCYHICAATKFTAIPADEWIEVIAQAVAIALRKFPQAQIAGHRDVTIPGHGTACPGQLWLAWKPRLVKRVGELLAPPVRRFKTLGIPIYQAQSLTGTLAGHLMNGEEIAIDRTYSNGAGHLASGLGFVDLNHDALEELS